MCQDTLCVEDDNFCYICCILLSKGQCFYHGTLDHFIKEPLVKFLFHDLFPLISLAFGGWHPTAISYWVTVESIMIEASVG